LEATVGIDIHQKRHMNGHADRNPNVSAYVGDGVGTSLRKGYFKHHWSYYKAKALTRNIKEAQKE